ncbi:ABC transporter permease [Candidatus Bathyarchaeota archaeon]|nr:MAG: ABC transporter permease [Candidatus Bathyarchaeota archaeon]
MVTKAGTRFQLKRAGGLLRLLVRNRMALIGMILLILFSSTALAAPLLSPYSTSDIVSGSLAQPEWVMNFPDGYYLSKNVVVVNDPLLSSPASVQAWAFTASSSTISNVQMSYAPGVFSSIPSQGSIQLAYSGASPGTVKLSQSFQFPYHGPPKKFIASFAVLISGASQASPVHVRVFIDRIGDQVFNLIDQDMTFNGQWLPQGGATALDSTADSWNNVPVKTILGTQNSRFDPATIIFSSIQSYSYGIELTFNGPAKVNIDSLQLKLYGTAFGLLGTDNAGNDLLSKNIYGSRISLLVGLLAAGIGISLGLLIGLMAGFLGRFVDEVLMRFTDMMLVIPSLPLLIVLVEVLGTNIWNVIIIIGFLGWMGFARVIRSQVLTLRERPYIEAAKAAGAGPLRIMSRHIFPNIVSLTYVNLALSVPAAILSEAALAFLGLSDASIVSWGHIFQDVNHSGALSLNPPPWWWVIPPGILIAAISLSFILIGYALDEIFNPKLRSRR